MNVTTAGAGAPVVSFFEDVVAFAMSVLAILAPLFALVAFAILAWLVWRVVRKRRGGRTASAGTG